MPELQREQQLIVAPRIIVWAHYQYLARHARLWQLRQREGEAPDRLARNSVSHITRWEPFTELGELRSRFDRMFDELTDGRQRTWAPAVDVERHNGRWSRSLARSIAD